MLFRIVLSLTPSSLLPNCSYPLTLFSLAVQGNAKANNNNRRTPSTHPHSKHLAFLEAGDDVDDDSERGLGEKRGEDECRMTALKTNVSERLQGLKVSIRASLLL